MSNVGPSANERAREGAPSDRDPREELAELAASLRAYLDWQCDTGAMGIPRLRRDAAGKPSRAVAAPPTPAAPRTTAAAVAATSPPALQPADSAERSSLAGVAAASATVEAAGTTAPHGEAARREAPPLDALPAVQEVGQPSAPPSNAGATSPVTFEAPAASAATNDAVATGAAPVTVSAPTNDAVATGAAPASMPDAPSPPRSLEVLARVAGGCTRCALAATRTNVVFSRGNPAAKVCFVGEAPGADEDAQGLPFVGRAGQLLDKMIGAMGLDPARDVYVCNIIKCRPPGNRKPEPVEIDTCIPYLHEQLAAVQPKVIIALGNTAVGALLGTKLGITKVRGQWKLYGGRTPVMPTYHPSYLLRPSAQQIEAKKQAWDDLQAVMKHLDLPPKKA